MPVEANASAHDKLTNHSFIQIVDRLILDKFHLIRRQGNKAAHEGYVDQHDAIWLVKEAYYIGVWLYIAYG
ncbi:hypothetical protein F7U70_000767 [Vibrio fluvialis]|nr:hypothetical protein [Vibrio fluvialis]